MSFKSQGALRTFCALAAAVSLAAQDAPAPALRITIIDGDEAINNIRQRTAREPIVQVEDENHRPVAGAVVLFVLPSDGPSATFVGGGNSLQVTTDATGRAVAHGLKPNNIAGRYQIRVSATSEGRTARATINQTNQAGGGGGGSTGKWLGIGGAAAAVGAIVAVVATRSSHASSIPPVQTTITPGTGTVGAPR